MRYLSIFILFSLFIFAQESGKELDFMTIGAGARPAGIGGSFTGIADDANSVYWNNGGMCLVRNSEITYMHADLYFGTTFDYISCVLPVKKIRDKDSEANNFIGFAMILASTGNIPITDTIDDYNRIIYEGIGGFRAGSYIIGYGRRINKKITSGIGIKIIDMELIKEYGKGYGIDIGFLYSNMIKNLSMGISLKDLTITKIKWSTGTIDNIAPNVRIGLSYRILKEEKEGGWIGKEGIVFSFDVDEQIKIEREKRWHKPRYHFGAEWKLVDVVPIRVGFDDYNFTAGIGFIAEHINVDYAYVSHQELKTTHRISITLKI
uniref:PorV/PorQ family protein n=1 Tax=candidate division WOR-3 bacterium TaxID=2052148 RepID=A0A7C4U7W1_UNCW3